MLQVLFKAMRRQYLNIQWVSKDGKKVTFYTVSCDNFNEGIFAEKNFDSMWSLKWTIFVLILDLV